MNHTITIPGGKLVWRDASGGLFEIVDIEVDNNARRCGIGRKLIEKLFAIVGPGKRVYAITRASNEVAQQFYEALKFEDVNPLRRFYCDQKGVDAMMYLRYTDGAV